MIRLYIIFIAAVIFPLLISAQDVCTAYLPGEGTKLTYVNYDKKGKEQSTATTEVTSVKIKGDTTYYKVHQLISTGKKKNDIENDYEYKCSGDVFVIDMQSILNQEMMEGYKDATLTVTTNHLILPGNLEPGMELEDGEVKIVAFIEPMTTNISARLFYREVEAREEITTPAGTFTAYKIKGYVEAKFAFMRVAYKTFEWYVKDLGIVKSESYDKKDKLMGKTELTLIEN
jgi:hypothetical protein